MFSFLKTFIIFKGSFETSLNDYIWPAEFSKIYTSYFQVLRKVYIL